MYDVIIVGARCAGSAVALLLARRGARVLLVDRATFPSDIPQGHFIHQHGPKRLQCWGLLDSIAARTPAVTSMLTDFGDFPLVARNLVEDGVAWGYGPRRWTLDKILLDAAIARGAEFREGFSVDEYLLENGAMAGISGRGPGGKQILERATLTVGADGRNSKLAHAVEAPVYNYTPPILGYYFSYWSSAETEDFELYVRNQKQRVVFSFKTEDALFAVFVRFPMEQLSHFRSNIEANFSKALETIPSFAERISAGHREERFYGAVDLPNFYRKPYGPGWALVGDAGLHKDPFMALGICDALRDAEFLADAIGDALASEGMEGALARYQKQRDEASAADYEQNIAGARMTPIPPEILAIRAAVKDDPEKTTRFVKARNRMIDPALFFNPGNLKRLLGRTAVAR
jgi:2-polyprenyl-6-methoxyphenol hydroxylase-like FAD-dependent oxidoreductase